MHKNHDHYTLPQKVGRQNESNQPLSEVKIETHTIYSVQFSSVCLKVRGLRPHKVMYYIYVVS